MRHKVFGNQLGRNTKQAKALYRGLTRELILRGRIETTLAKAKAIIPMVDHIITLAKKNSVSARREIVKTMGNDNLLDKLFNEVAPAFASRNSGFTRIIRLRDRFSDTTEMAVMELVEMVAVEPKKSEIRDTSKETQVMKPEAKKIEKPKAIKKVVKSKKVVSKKKR